MIRSIIVVTLLAAGALCVAASVVQQLDSAMAPDASASPFEESYISYDLHQDFHYFRDDYVNEAFSRKKYVDTKITMGGQARDMTGRQVLGAKNPFAVAQRSLGKIGVSTDRWDVKENKEQPFQYFGLYHGYNSNFVVNKLRANLLRRLANAVKDYLPVLDKTSETFSGLKDFKGTVFGDFADMIKSTFVDIDKEILEQMNDNDKSSATASVVIVTEKFIITANAGDNRVIAYDGVNGVSEYSAVPESYIVADNVFGAKSTNIWAPTVSIHPRTFEDEDGDESKVHFVLVESPLVSQLVNDEEASKIIVSEIVQHRESLTHEQKLYEDSVTRILQTATDRVGGVSKAFFPELFQKSDYAAILIGLDRDYKNIH